MRKLSGRLPLPAAGLLLAATLGTPAAAQAVGRVPVAPPPPVETWKPGKPSRSACIDATRIAGAIVVDPRTLDVVLKGGKRWRLTLAQQCPQLSYYGGFYYEPQVSGQFCAGRDRIIGRAGGACRVSHIAPLQRVQPRRR
jgi:hypothetical protein